MQTTDTTERKTLRGYRQKCRIQVQIGEAEPFETILLFGDGANIRPIGDKVYLFPQGWFNTDDVTFLELLPWKED